VNSRLVSRYANPSPVPNPTRLHSRSGGFRQFNAMTSEYSVELPGIEPVSGCWSLSRAGTELRNDTDCDSPELTSVDTECAQNVPSQSLD
jgi:hypothetical protein